MKGKTKGVIYSRQQSLIAACIVPFSYLAFMSDKTEDPQANVKPLNYREQWQVYRDLLAL